MSPAEPGHPDAADHGPLRVYGLADQRFPTVVVELGRTSLLPILARALVDDRLLPDVAVLGSMGASEFGTHALENLRASHPVHRALTLTLTPADAASLGRRLLAAAADDDTDDLGEAR